MANVRRNRTAAAGSNRRASDRRKNHSKKVGTLHSLIPRPSLLILSDIQLGEFGRYRLADRSSDAAIEEEGRAFAKELSETFRHHSVSPHVLVLAGDLASTGKMTEFVAVRHFLDSILQAPGFDPECVVFCPGNHDVDLSEEAKDLRLAAFCRFADRFYADYEDRLVAPSVAPWRTEPKPSNTWSFFDLEEKLNLLIVSLNSAESIVGRRAADGSLDLHPQGASGSVSEEQLRAIESEVSIERFRTTPSLAILHHNLVHGRRHPKPSAPGQIVIAENYLETIAYLEKWHVDVVIHGHQHEPYISFHQFYDGPELRAAGMQRMKGVVLVGVGSVAAAAEEIPYATKYHFETLRIDVGDPTTRQIAECCAYEADRTSGEALRWSPKPAQALMWPEPPPEWDARFNALDPGRSLFVAARNLEDGLQRMLSVVAGLRHPLFASVLRGSVESNSVEASTLSTPEASLLADVLSADRAIQLYDQEATQVSLQRFRVDGKRLRARLKKQSWIEHSSLQLSRLVEGKLEKVYEVTAWLDHQDLGIACGFADGDSALALRRSSLPKAIARVVGTLTRFWALAEHREAFSGPMAEEFFAPLDDLGPARNGGRFASPMERLLENCLGDDSAAWYQEHEPFLYRAKRLIERAILFAIIDRETDLTAVQNLARRVSWDGSDFGEVVDPLLVSFWLPWHPQTLDGADESLRWVPTRDQVLYVLGRHRSTDAVRQRCQNLRDLMAFEMRSYERKVFEGVAAYVLATGKAVFSDNAYSIALTTGRVLREAAIPEREKRAKLRARISEIEKDFWMEGATPRPHATLQLPLWGGKKVEAVLSIQTATRDAKRWMGSAGVLEALQSLELPLELLRSRTVVPERMTRPA